MKIKIDIDCTPEEAADRFFGLPDVAPMQDAGWPSCSAHERPACQSMDAGT